MSVLNLNVISFITRRIMQEVLGAVKFMHDNEIVHRDLKVSIVQYQLHYFAVCKF